MRMLTAQLIYEGSRQTFAAFKVRVFWAVTTGSVVVGYQTFGGLCCFHVQGTQLRVCICDFIS
jgi:hypothetical protein